MTPDVTFASRLKAARAAAGLSQPQLADRSGVPVTTIRQLERGGRAEPKLYTAARLAVALGCATGFLAGVEPAPKNFQEK